ncbi:hypothetical protein PBI_WHIRLWIND_132 [Mycobacterium phage Whirlwind]|uniref:Uncharacterized protein n=1 Tax=Mycobacterium phage Whirlwind TaxID=1340826 RepID=S5YMQ5_9CAUD|nr:hypothetical protein N852_gp057 [Mycobacterium phage Whirlwind]AGT12728.1 hypothetical protein PBI_WHIRLWIND_132 [Mycobacterium phage Whirlwind]
MCGVRLRVPTALLGASNACLRAWLLGAVLLGRASRAPGRCPGEKTSSSVSAGALLALRLLSVLSALRSA